MNMHYCGWVYVLSAIRRTLLAALIVLFLACPAFAQTPALRIMPLGDSITFGANTDGIGGGYRYPLYVALTNAGYTVELHRYADDDAPRWLRTGNQPSRS